MKKKLRFANWNRLKHRLSFLIVLLLFNTVASAQEIVTVKGKINDSIGQPLAGVTIKEKNGSTGVASDRDGNYTITTTRKAVLVYSFIGLKTQEISVNNKTIINVRLLENYKNLDDVVVIGYGTQTRKELSSAVSTVGSKAIGRQVVSSFENALQGQAPGVLVSNPSGQPGSAINISIRGKNSVSLSTSPLYVIDGVPVQPSYDQELGYGGQKPNPLSTINPSDIESIDILKDGASAAIYGSRASNGVVVITTKKGKAGKPQISFNTYFGRQELRKKLDLLDGAQWANVFNQSLVNAGQAVAYNPDTVKTNTDWQDLIYHKANISSYQLSIGGGTDKTKYYISGSYFNQDGIIKNSGFERYAAKINLDQQVTDKFKIGTTLNLSNTQNNRSIRSEAALNNAGVILGAIEQIPTLPVYNRNGTYALNPFSQSDNPYSNLVESKDIAKINQVFGNAYGEYSFAKNLIFKTSIGVDYRSQIENQFNTRELSSTQNSPSASRGSAATGTNTQTIWLWENNLTYNPNIGINQSLNFLAGFSAQNSDRFTSSASGYGFPSDAVPYLFAASNFNKPSSYQDQWGLISYYGRANYNYKERYYASASIRADGSSRFDPKKRFGYFPAVSAAWRISEENFFPKDGILSDVKLRASFGANGNQNIGVYDRFSTYGTGFNYFNYNGDGSVIGGIAPNKIGNSNLTWETTYQYDAGLDFGLLNNRINITADVYLKKTKNLLTNVPLSASSGAEAGSGSNATITQNVGQVENGGFELGINTVNVRSNNGFNWTTNFNFSLNRNKVIDLGTLLDANGKTIERKIIGDYSIVKKGQPLGAFYGYFVKGIFQNASEISSAPKQPNAAPGDLRFADLNGDNVINESDRTIIGNPNPKFIGGITNTLSFKGVDLSFFFQGSFGNDIYNQNRTFTENMLYPINQSTVVLNAWTPAHTNTTVPRTVLSDPNGNARFSTKYVEKGTYVRLKNLSIGYTLPSGIFQKAKISSVRLYATAQNLLTFTNYEGYDPEVNADPLSNTSFGRDYGVYPQARIYTVGLNASF